MPTVNLATNYADKIGARYFRKSVVAELSLPQSGISFDGSKTVVVTTPRTVPLGDYKRHGVWRFGDVDEVGNDIQKFTVEFDKSWTGTFDKGNQADSKAIEEAAAKFLSIQMDNETTPFVDQLALYRWAHDAGMVVEASGELTQEDVLDMISFADVSMSDNRVPNENRSLIIGWQLYHKVRMAEVLTGADSLSADAVRKGDVGDLFGMRVRCVPTSYLPAGCRFLILQRDAAFVVEKIKEARVHTDAPGISGSLCEGRIYTDAFVREEKSNGVLAFVDPGQKLATPTASITGSSATLTNVPSGAVALYTTDGSDPRYSATAQPYSADVTLADGDTFRAAYKPVRAAGETPDTKFTSDVYGD